MNKIQDLEKQILQILEEKQSAKLKSKLEVKVGKNKLKSQLEKEENKQQQNSREISVHTLEIPRIKNLKNERDLLKLEKQKQQINHNIKGAKRINQKNFQSIATTPKCSTCRIYKNYYQFMSKTNSSLDNQSDQVLSLKPKMQPKIYNQLVNQLQLSLTPKGSFAEEEQFLSNYQDKISELFMDDANIYKNALQSAKNEERHQNQRTNSKLPLPTEFSRRSIQVKPQTPSIIVQKFHIPKSCRIFFIQIYQKLIEKSMNKSYTAKHSPQIPLYKLQLQKDKPVIQKKPQKKSYLDMLKPQILEVQQVKNTHRKTIKTIDSEDQTNATSINADAENSQSKPLHYNSLKITNIQLN